MAETVHKRGGWIVAVVVALAVIAGLLFALPMLDRSTDRPQGKLAPDSNEGVNGQGSPATKRSTPELNAQGGDIDNTVAGNTGANAPGDPNASRQDAPNGSLRSGPNVGVEESREPGRAAAPAPTPR